jgi:hypothetical protein
VIAIVSVLIAGSAIIVVLAAAFILIVVNIQMVDRSKRLMHEPRDFFDAATRRLLGASGHSSSLRRTKES